MREFENEGEALKVLLYGRLAEAIGAELEFDASPDCSIAQLRDRLIADYPETKLALCSKRARACVGDTIVHDDFVPGASQTVEFLPPVSGG